ncbi:MAG TPA: hypothetical protein VIG34_08240 [Xanthobacteraceae bacterium]|jgi:hypothetical protein
MRPIQLALAAATALVLAAGSAQASPLNALRGSQIAADGIEVTQNVQQYCFYLDGWRGPGFYRCGFRLRRGLGWHGTADSRPNRGHGRRDSRVHTRFESRRGTR